MESAKYSEIGGEIRNRGQCIIASGWMDASAHLIFIYIREHPLRTSPKKWTFFTPSPMSLSVPFSQTPLPPKRTSHKLFNVIRIGLLTLYTSKSYNIEGYYYY